MAELEYRALCVRNAEAAARFYADAFDFEAAPLPDSARSAGAGASSPIVDQRLLRRADGASILLTEFMDLAPGSSTVRRPALSYGLYHLSFYLDDIDAAAGRVVAAGGTVWEHTRAYYPENTTTMLYCTDHDGIRIELMHSPGIGERYSHNGICIDDIDAAIAYYELLGFSLAHNYVFAEGATWLDAINEVEDIRLRAQMMTDRAGTMIELLKVTHPPVQAEKRTPTTDQLGLTHLSLVDKQPARLAAELTARGHHVMALEETFLCLDPDGARLHLTHGSAQVTP
jgi:catechol 2,3-dioxygenase-like lactoylglutathione lyase family enzyme